MLLCSLILSYVFKSINEYLNLKVLIAGCGISISTLLIYLFNIDLPEISFDSDFIYFLSIWIYASIITSLIWWIWIKEKEAN